MEKITKKNETKNFNKNNADLTKDLKNSLCLKIKGRILSKNDINNFFSKFGKIEEIVVKKSDTSRKRHQICLSFKEKESACDVAKKKCFKLKGRKIKVVTCENYGFEELEQGIEYKPGWYNYLGQDADFDEYINASGRLNPRGSQAGSARTEVEPSSSMYIEPAEIESHPSRVSDISQDPQINIYTQSETDNMEVLAQMTPGQHNLIIAQHPQNDLDEFNEFINQWYWSPRENNQNNENPIHYFYREPYDSSYENYNDLYLFNNDQQPFNSYFQSLDHQTPSNHINRTYECTRRENITVLGPSYEGGGRRRFAQEDRIPILKVSQKIVTQIEYSTQDYIYSSIIDEKVHWSNTFSEYEEPSTNSF